MDDESAVAATVSGYWEGWFDGDAERMHRALHPALVKTPAGWRILNALYMRL